MTRTARSNGGGVEAEAVGAPMAAGGKVSIFDVFETDPERENEGVWRVIDGYSFKIRRANCPQHEAVLGSLGEAKRRAFQNGELPEDEAARVSARVAGEGLVADWDSRFTETFSSSTATEFFRRSPHIAGRVFQLALDYHNFLRVDREHDAKN